MIVCGLDFEATSLDVNEARIIEAGAVLWDTERNVPLKLYSEFVDCRIDIPEMRLSDETVEVTGITDDLLDAWGMHPRDALNDINRMAAQADFVLAHNGSEYDVHVWRNELKRHGIENHTPMWADSRTDIVFPERIKTRNLLHLAAEHGFLPLHGHRAVFDVLTMLQIASRYDWNAIIARAKEPTFFVQAVVSFNEKELAKERGYYWAPQQKVWHKAMKQSDYMREKDECGFKTQLLTVKPE